LAVVRMEGAGRFRLAVVGMEGVRTDRRQASGMNESGDGGSPNLRRRSAGGGAGPVRWVEARV
jgi:hypothetical protein